MIKKETGAFTEEKENLNHKGSIVYVERSGICESHVHTGNYHYHDYYEMYYLYRGDRCYFIKDNTYCIAPGSLVLIKPYDIHGTGKISLREYDRCLIYFYKSFIMDLLSEAGCAGLLTYFVDGGAVIQFPEEERGRVESLLSLMIDESQTQRAGYLPFMKAAILQLLLLASRYAESGEASVSPFYDGKSTQQRVSEIASYIHKHYHEELTLGAVSDAFYINPSYLSRIFKRVTGRSFVEYINGVRLKEAQKLLRGSDKKIESIAEEVGYKSNTHFGRAFRAVFGISPTAYRRRMQKAPRE